MAGRSDLIGYSKECLIPSRPYGSRSNNTDKQKKNGVVKVTEKATSKGNKRRDDRKQKTQSGKNMGKQSKGRHR